MHLDGGAEDELDDSPGDPDPPGEPEPDDGGVDDDAVCVAVRVCELECVRGWVCGALDPPVPAAAGADPSEARTRTVSTSRATSAMIEASSANRRRQYTDDGWSPTG